jgi:hypothetical protein
MIALAQADNDNFTDTHKQVKEERLGEILKKYQDASMGSKG